MICLYTDPEEWEPDFEEYTQEYKIDWPVAWIRPHSSVSADYLTRHLQPCLILVGPAGNILLRDHDVARFRAALTSIVAKRASSDCSAEKLPEKTDAVQSGVEFAQPNDDG